MLQPSLDVNVKVLTGGESRHVWGLWSEVGPCMKAAANMCSELRVMAGPQVYKEKLLSGQEGLKHWGDPDVSNALAPAWTWYWSKPVNVIPNSSILIMNTGIDVCWDQSFIEAPIWGKPLPRFTWESGNMWNVEFTRLLVLTTPKTHTRCWFTRILRETHKVAHTHMHKKHTVLPLAFSPG